MLVCLLITLFLNRAMHSIYCFSEKTQYSVTRHFGNPSYHHGILHDPNIYEHRKNPSGLSMIWCSSVINKSYRSFRDIQKVTIKILNEAIE
ncbi:hypothetical protein BDC45DRAFT_132150 [Circinella umbellata]|nr:hypothetical protein BDC45DRAFT_132150 [Circinella umbellata]